MPTPLKVSDKFYPLLLILIILMSFGNSLCNGFVYDDGYLIVQNSFLRDFGNIKTILFSDVTVATSIGKASGYYRPLSMLYLMAGYHAWGLNTFFWHLGSLVLHAFNVLLVFRILRKMGCVRNLAFLTSLFFAVHPIHVEAVTPVYNVMGVLAAFFSLASFLMFLKSGALKNKRYSAASWLLFLCAVFTKEETLILPVIFLLYDYYFYAKFKIRALSPRIKTYALFFVPAVLYLAMRIVFIEKGAALGLWHFPLSFNVPPPAQNNLLFFAFQILRLYGKYIYLLFFPLNLNAYHVIVPLQNILDVNALSPAGIFIALLGAAFYLRLKQPLVSFFIWFFFLSSLLVSNIFPIGGIFAERFMYLPSLSFCFLIGFCFIHYFPKRLMTICAAGLVIFYSLLTITRNYVWRTDVLLWKDTVSKSPYSSMPHLNLAVAYMDTQKYGQALNEFEAALRFPSPKVAQIHNAIGKIYARKGMYQKALEEFNKALSLRGDLVESYYDAGLTYFYLNDFENAQELFQKAISLNEKYPWSYYGLGLVYEKRGNKQLSLQMFEKALVLDEKFSPAKEAIERVRK